MIPLIPLDLPTLMAMESFVAVLAGLALLFGWWLNREATSLLPWAASNILVSFGIYDLYMGASTGNPVWLAVGGFSLSLAGGLGWAAMRMFSHKSAPLLVIVLGAASSVALGIFAALNDIPQIASAVPLVAGCAYYFAAAATLWGARKEKLAARWPMMGLLLIHSAVLATGAIEVLVDQGQANLLAAIGTAFGAIHFESIVFALGTAAFFLVMTKERSELHSRRAAHTDGLTGIANRQSFMEGAERQIVRCRRNKTPITVVMFDLDRFKGINDGHGHGTGDQVIRHFVRVARDALRPTDLFGRIGGEEFALALPGADIDTGFARADRIRMEFGRASFSSGEETFAATVSAGVATDSGRPLTMLLAEADAALYRAKAEGRNRVVKTVDVSDKGKAVLRVA